MNQLIASSCESLDEPCGLDKYLIRRDLKCHTKASGDLPPPTIRRKFVVKKSEGAVVSEVNPNNALNAANSTAVESIDLENLDEWSRTFLVLTGELAVPSAL